MQTETSSLSHDRYQSDWNRFYKGSWLADAGITSLKASKIKEYYREISANACLTRRGLNNAKTILKIRFWSVVNMAKELNPVEVQYMAGHLDPATTDHYRKRVSKLEGVDTEKWNSLYSIAK